VLEKLPDRGLVVVDTSEAIARRAKVAQIKQQISAGTYETPDKLAVALYGFLDDYQAGLLRPGEDRPSRPDHPK
jgi:hypothetical protein